MIEGIVIDTQLFVVFNITLCKIFKKNDVEKKDKH